MPNVTLVKTSKVTGRRSLKFTNLDEVMADANRLIEAEQQRRLQKLGNWSLGQNLGHLGSWVNFSFDGVPMKIPAVLRWVSRFGKNRFLYKPMSPGSTLPWVAGGTLGIEPLSTDEGIAKFTQAFTKLKTHSPAIPHVLFGPMTHDEWINQHLRHSELHLSFFQLQ